MDRKWERGGWLGIGKGVGDERGWMENGKGWMENYKGMDRKWEEMDRK